jgi:hypothetical protein
MARTERLVRYVLAHGFRAEPVPFEPNVLLCTFPVVRSDGTIDDDHELIPATWTSVRTWLGY